MGYWAGLAGDTPSSPPQIKGYWADPPFPPLQINGVLGAQPPEIMGILG